MFDEFTNNILAIEREPIPNRQETNTTPDVIEKSSKKKISKYQPDIEVLKEKYGDQFSTGFCIEITLKEILKIVKRDRKRTEAYKGLQTYLKKELGIELTIKSQKTK